MSTAQSGRSDEHAAALSQWTDLTFAVYPEHTVRLLNSVKDQFRNPVGETIRAGLDELLSLIESETPIEGVPEALDRIVRIRSVQDLSAGQAIRFVFELKAVLANRKDRERLFGRIDQLALIAFGAYQGCREQLYHIRANEEKARNTKLLQRAQQIIHHHATGQVPDMNETGKTHPQGGGRT